MKRGVAVTSQVIGLVLVLMVSLQGYAQNQQQPATLRSLLLHQLHTTHNQADWFVPISVAVDGLTAEQASWQPPAGGHSAGQLTYHLLFWNRRNLVKFRGETLDKFGGDNDETFAKFDTKQWNDTVRQLDQVMTDLEKLVETADEKKLASFATTIGNICTHNAYHVGQIVYVRKLQGSWNAEKGVKASLSHNWFWAGSLAAKTAGDKDDAPGGSTKSPLLAEEARNGAPHFLSQVSECKPVRNRARRRTT